MNKRIVSFFFLLLFTGSIYAAIGITDLRTEQLKNPAGIDVRQPRLSWRIESDEQNVIQTAYHILVASSPELLEQGKGDIWDSGKIESDASQWITYQGKTLKCNAPYYWKVKIDTNKGVGAAKKKDSAGRSSDRRAYPQNLKGVSVQAEKNRV